MFKKRFTLGLLFLASKLILNVKATCAPAIVDSELQISGDCTTGYYLKDNSAKAVTVVSSCTDSAKCTLMKCSALNENCIAASITGYIIFTLDNSLLYCSAGQCYSVTSPGGLYVNGDTTTDVNPVIQCASGSACFSVAYATACSSGLGGIIANNKFCFSTTDANGQDITGETVIYDLLTLTADTTPFGSANNKVLVKVGNSAVEKVTDPTGYYAVSSAEMLVQCDAENHACTPVTSPQGYYVNAGEDSASKPVIQCDGTACSTTSTTKSKCSTVDKIGDLVAISNAQTNFCPSKTDGTQISFSADRTEAGFYLLTIAKDSKSVFTGNTAVTADTTVVVQAGIGEVVPVANPTGYYINAGAAANTPSVIKCDASHVCEIITSTGGFYVNGDTSTDAKPVIQCVSGDSCAAIDGVDSCSTGKVKTENIYCVDNSNEADFKATTVSYYLLTVAKSSTSVFTGKNAVGDNTKILVQYGNDAIFVVDSPSGYYVNSDTTSPLVYCDSTGCDDHETAGGYYLNAGEDKSANPVITCTGTTIACTATQATTTTSCASVASIGGLVKISDNFNYFCPEKTEGKQITINSDATLTYHKLTISANDNNPFTGTTESTTDPKDILVKVGNGAAELITNASNSENVADFYAVKESNVITDMTAYDKCSPNNGIIKYNFAASSGSITTVRQCIQPCNLASTNATGCKEGYYLADDDKKYVKDTTVTSGTLYQCVKDADGKFQCSAVANPPLGYLVNQGNQADPEDVPFIRCEVSGKDTVCKPYTIDSAITSCSGSIGKIISEVKTVSGHDITTYSICVDTTAEATIVISTRAAVEDEPNLKMTAETNTAGSYMISNVMYDSTLTDGEFIKVDVDGGNVTINQEPNPIRYQYGDNGTHKIYDSFTCTVTDGVTTVNEPTSPKEYKLDYDTSNDTIYFYSTDA